jgi:uncharacterized membrane protein
MVFMALDHVRDYVTNIRVQPERLAQHGSVALFATRWITHFCAPVFMLLAGVGVGLSMMRGKSPAAMSRFLITRGLWLIVLDLFITPFAWRFSLNPLPLFALVLWALGLSMIILAGLIHLPKPVVAAISLIAIFTHNMLDGVNPDSLGGFSAIYHILHAPGFAVPNVFLIGYPIVPWFGVMALGWVLASMYGWAPERRKRCLITIGLATTALFMIVRGYNHYGDLIPWSHQKTAALTVASFFNVFKYPPSLDFLLMTLGPALVALALLENARGRIAGALAIVGSVPLFYYVVHIPVAHLAGVIIAFAQHGVIMRIPAVDDPSKIPAWYGVSLPGVYLAWALVVLTVFPLCVWYSRLKKRRRDWWLSYL